MLRWATVACLALLTVAAFAGVLRAGWILYDDPRYVYENAHVKHGLTPASAAWALHAIHGDNWHPLTSWSHMLDASLFGLRPAGHHAVNLLWHVLNALLLLAVLRRLTGAWWRSALVAALFAVHPLRVESVAWVSERKDVLSTFFFLLAIGAYQRWTERPTRGRWAAVAAAAALGLLAKPMLVTLPFVLLLLDAWPLGRIAGLGIPAARAGAPPPGRPDPALARSSLAARVREKWLLFALAGASAVTTFAVQRASGAVASMGALDPGRRLANALLSVWRYPARTLWPHDLVPFYPYPSRFGAIAVAAAAAGLVLVTALVLVQARRRPWLGVGWLWYLGTLVPVIGLVQVGAQAIADRYTYVPGMGLLVLAAWGAGEWAGGSRPRRVAAAAVSVALLAACATATARQVARWHDTRTLFEYVLAVDPANPVAHQNVGDVLLREGRLSEAVPHYRAVLARVPGAVDAHNKLGAALGAMGRLDDAIAEFQLGLRLRPGAELHHNLGYSYAGQGRAADARREYEAALALDPDHVPSLIHLAEDRVAQGRAGDAERLLRRALALEPERVEARRALAVALTVEGRVEEAIGQYRLLLERAPDDLDALNNIAWIRATHAERAHRDGGEAVRLAERARDRSPEPQPVLFSTLAAAYAEAGRFPDAVAAGGRAVALARAAGDATAARAYEDQLARYRAGRPYHFGE